MAQSQESASLSALLCALPAAEAASSLLLLWSGIYKRWFGGGWYSIMLIWSESECQIMSSSSEERREDDKRGNLARNPSGMGGGRGELPFLKSEVVV